MSAPFLFTGERCKTQLIENELLSCDELTAPKGRRLHSDDGAVETEPSPGAAKKQPAALNV